MSERRAVIVNHRKLLKPAKPLKPEAVPSLVYPELPGAERLAPLMMALETVAKAHHSMGDAAAREERKAAKAGYRRTQRNRQSLNHKTRAVGTACEATYWLFGVMAKDMKSRGVATSVATELLAATVEDAMSLIDDLVFEAHVPLVFPAQDREGA